MAIIKLTGMSLDMPERNYCSHKLVGGDGFLFKEKIRWTSKELTYSSKFGSPKHPFLLSEMNKAYLGSKNLASNEHDFRANDGVVVCEEEPMQLELPNLISPIPLLGSDDFCESFLGSSYP
ncbi:hypothetical protein OIU79_022196 [Salix purpurea]|uniref:Uncharacterized protein n=1 Tax=Salix purpurea TaxID=77065 RepID=A0A9Q0WGA8_SALPP|nr:hypothetical protein OIU79_022196 [Salix purpurea]